MWRTSWLSRECLCLPVFLACASAYGVAHWFASPYSLVIGALGVVASGALFVCTAMIYACLRFLQEWATPLTMVNFVLLGCASGFTHRHRLRGVARPGAGRRACRLRVRADASRAARAASHRSRATHACGRSRRCRARPASRGRTSCRSRAASPPARSTCASSFTDRRRARLQRVKWTFLVVAFGVPFVLMVLGASTSSVGVSIALFCAACVFAIRGARRGTLVLLRGSAASAEPVLRASRVAGRPRDSGLKQANGGRRLAFAVNSARRGVASATPRRCRTPSPPCGVCAAVGMKIVA